MPTWFAVILTCIAFVIAGIANDPIVWNMTWLLVVVIWLFRILGKRDERSRQVIAARRASYRFAASRRETPPEILSMHRQDYDDPPGE